MLLLVQWYGHYGLEILHILIVFCFIVSRRINKRRSCSETFMGKTQLGKLLGRDEERVQAQKIANFVAFAILNSSNI